MEWFFSPSLSYIVNGQIKKNTNDPLEKTTGASQHITSLLVQSKWSTQNGYAKQKQKCFWTGQERTDNAAYRNLFVISQQERQRKWSTLRAPKVELIGSSRVSAYNERSLFARCISKPTKRAKIHSNLPLSLFVWELFFFIYGMASLLPCGPMAHASRISRSPPGYPSECG